VARGSHKGEKQFVQQRHWIGNEKIDKQRASRNQENNPQQQVWEPPEKSKKEKTQHEV